MKPSRYLQAFKHVDVSSLTHELIGDALLVERIPHEEQKTAGGIIMPVAGKQVNSMGADLPTLVHVLSVGKGFYDTTTNEISALGVDAGDIVMVGSLSIKWFSLLEIEGYEPYSIGLTRESEIQLRYKGLEAYHSYFQALNSKLKERLPDSLL